MEENLLFFVIIIMIKRKNKKNTLVLEVKVVQIILQDINKFRDRYENKNINTCAFCIHKRI